jgi:hypothetical protein
MALNFHLASAICFCNAFAGIRVSGQDFKKVFDIGIQPASFFVLVLGFFDLFSESKSGVGTVLDLGHDGSSVPLSTVLAMSE